MQKSYFIPENKNIDILFKEFQKNKIFVALLIDEYGSFSGLVTMEDFIEEVMGDIEEIYDEDESKLEKLDKDNYLVDGLYSMRELNYDLDMKLENDDVDTVSDFVINLLGKIPEEREKLKVEYNNLTFEVLEIKDHCIQKIKIIIKEEKKIE